MIHAVKISLVLLFLASCQVEKDPEPQKSCSQLKVEIEAAQKAILDHHAKGNEGNQASWESELKRLNDIKTVKANEYATRHC